MNIAIAGSGYVGLVTAAVLANMGHNVTAMDIDTKKIDQLKAGNIPIYEPGLKELICKNRERLTFTDDCSEAYRNADIIFIAVGTPEKKDGSANLKYVYDAAEQIAASVRHYCVIVIKSTVPIGTNDKIQQYINSKLPGGIKVDVVSNPEFLSQGTAVKDMLNASRIVVGVESDTAKAVMEELYRPMNLPLLFTDRRSAEMIKYASNDFLALKISYINEIANLCEVLDADINDVAKGMGMDPRIGDKFLQADIGYGGSCFPKDTKALHWLSNYHDYEIKTIKAAIEVNSNQKIRLIKKARKYYNSMEGLIVAVLGLSFKPGTDDLREAPSLYNIPILIDDGAKVKAWDPIATGNFKKLFPNEIEYCDKIEDALKDADLCMIFTEWNEVKSLSPEVFLKMKKPVILDGRNCFDLNIMARYPLIYDSIGRRTIKNI